MRILDVDSAPPSEARHHTGHLIEGEAVGALFVSATGAVMFTDRRILLLFREHLLEEKSETSSYSYRAVTRFSIQEGKGGRSTLRIWLGEEQHPLHLRANAGTDLRDVQRLLAEKLI